MTRLRVGLGILGAIFAGITPSVFASGINGTGAVGTCALQGSISFKPALVNGGTSPTTDGVKTKGPKGSTCSGGSGDGATIVTGAAKGSLSTPNNSCTGLIGTMNNPITLTFKWKVKSGSPHLNPSTITITSTTGGVSGDGHGTFTATGTVTSGSFMGDTVSATIKTDQTAGDLGTACGGKGLKKITFDVKPGSDSVLGNVSITIS